MLQKRAPQAAAPRRRCVRGSGRASTAVEATASGSAGGSTPQLRTASEEPVAETGVSRVPPRGRSGGSPADRGGPVRTAAGGRPTTRGSTKAGRRSAHAPPLNGSAGVIRREKAGLCVLKPVADELQCPNRTCGRRNR